MALPGFNADASLYVSSEQYRATAPVGALTHAVAVPQQASWSRDCPRGCNTSPSCCDLCDEGWGSFWSTRPFPHCNVG
jgi:hypothetical protein